jgi:hypothetical protein
MNPLWYRAHLRLLLLLSLAWARSMPPGTTWEGQGSAWADERCRCGERRAEQAGAFIAGAPQQATPGAHGLRMSRCWRGNGLRHSIPCGAGLVPCHRGFCPLKMTAVGQNERMTAKVYTLFYRLSRCIFAYALQCFGKANVFHAVPSAAICPHLSCAVWVRARPQSCSPGRCSPG